MASDTPIEPQTTTTTMDRKCYLHALEFLFSTILMCIFWL